MIRRIIERLAPPRYAWGPLIAAFVVNCLAYWIPLLFPSGREYRHMALPLDDRLPLVTPFVLFYVLAYFQWGVSYLLAARDSRALCHEVVTADLIAKIVTLGFFLLMPATMSQPEITGNGPFDLFTRVIYYFDKPVNLFPSIHCLESWMALRTGFKLQRAPGWYRWGGAALSLLVFASTVLIKQHVVVDILAGIAVAELGLQISRPFFHKKA